MLMQSMLNQVAQAIQPNPQQQLAQQMGGHLQQLQQMYQPQQQGQPQQQAPPGDVPNPSQQVGSSQAPQMHDGML
jgi:hypothetical protein